MTDTEMEPLGVFEIGKEMGVRAPGPNLGLGRFFFFFFWTSFSSLRLEISVFNLEGCHFLSTLFRDIV